MDTGNTLRIAAGALVALLGLIVAARMPFELRVTQEHMGIALILVGVFFAYRAVAAYYDAQEREPDSAQPDDLPRLPAPQHQHGSLPEPSRQHRQSTVIPGDEEIVLVPRVPPADPFHNNPATDGRA
jgi:uncharacterized membrane protein YebE (DUF533 family)